MQRIDRLPLVLTSFAYRSEYFPELDGMIESVRQHHPGWLLVTGRGPVPNTDSPTLAVESPTGALHWKLPVPLDLDGSENDWLRIVRMKAWWVARVWYEFGNLSGPHRKRLVWLDADARFTGSLDIMFDPTAELIAGPWGGAEGTVDDHVCSGFLLFQGHAKGVVESVIDQWSTICLGYIQSPPPPSPIWPYGQGDQEVLTTVLRSQLRSGAQFTLAKLDYDKYCGELNYKDGTSKPGALIDQRKMIERMRYPKDRNRAWPPPEPSKQRGAS